MQRKPTAYEKMQIAARIFRTVRTVDRLYDGKKVSEPTYRGALHASRELGLPEPPPPRDGDSDRPTAA